MNSSPPAPARRRPCTRPRSSAQQAERNGHDAVAD
jgi:hypothetical protein